MLTRPEYEQAHTHRESGLERTVLVACSATRDALPDGGVG